MSGDFNFDKLDAFELFHLKYGRGAIIVAMKKDNKGARQASLLFNCRRDTEYDLYNEVVSIKESGGFVNIKVIMKNRYPNRPNYKPLDSIIERTLPSNQVTLEIIREVKVDNELVA